MKRIFTVLTSWTILMAACASFTSCGDDDDDDDKTPSKENTNNNSDNGGSTDHNTTSNDPLEKAIANAYANCKEFGDVVRNGDDQLFTKLGSLLKSVEFKDGKAISTTNYADLGSEKLAKVAYEEGKKELDKYESSYRAGRYVAIVSTDPDEIEDYEGMTIDEVEKYLKNLLGGE